VDVGDDPTARYGGLDQRVQLLVPPDGELEVAGRDALHLEVLAGVPGQFQNLRRQVLEDGGRVDGRRGPHPVALVDAPLQEAVDPTDGELQAGLGTPRLGCLLAGGGLPPLAALPSLSTFSGLSVRLLMLVLFWRDGEAVTVVSDLL
jgi:hypothetical protein